MKQLGDSQIPTVVSVGTCGGTLLETDMSSPRPFQNQVARRLPKLMFLASLSGN
jgi:hypothetical protein